jgi:hypothetical protein
MPVRYILGDFLSGRELGEVPVMEGTSWALSLNKADTLEAKLNFNDAGTRALDPVSITEPRKTILAAVTDDDVVLAWGQIDPSRKWDDDTQTMTVTASGAWSYWGRCLIGTPDARTATLAPYGLPNSTLDVSLAGYGLSTVAKKLMQQRMGWPGATMPFIFPAADELVASRVESFEFLDLGTIGSAMSGFTERNGGPDFDFTASYVSGSGFTFPVRMGTDANPFLGSDVASWTGSGPASPVVNLQIEDEFSDFGTAAWAASQGGQGTTLASRALNDALRAQGGYPPEDYVDSSRTDVDVQSTLDEYVAEDLVYASRYHRTLSFALNSRHTDETPVAPGLGQYRPGDYVTLTFDGHRYLGTGDIRCRIMDMSGDETGDTVKFNVLLEGQ